MIRRRTVVLATAASALVLAALSVPAAWAQEGTGPELSIRSVDGTDPEKVVVDFLYRGERADLNDLAVREDGRRVDISPVVSIDEADEQLGIVLTIDTSKSMQEDARFERAQDAARAFVENKADTDRMAIVSFNDDATVAQRFTSDADELIEAIDGLALSPNTALYDGVRESVNLFDGTDLQPNIVLLSDGADNASATSADTARGLVSDSGAVVFAVALGDGFDDELSELVEVSGGQLVTTTDAGDLEGIYADIQRTLRNQYRITFASQADEPGLTELLMAVGNEQAKAQYTPGSESSGSQLVVTDTGDPSGPKLFRTSGGLYLALLLVLAAVGLGVYSLVTTFVRDRSKLSTVLQPYSEGYVAAADDDEQHDSLVQTPLLQRAVQLTGDLAERRGFLEKTEFALERASLPLRAAEALFFYVAFVFVAFLLAGALAQDIFVALIAAFIGALIPPATVSFLANRRRKQFQALLPDMLQLLSGTLRAGYSLMQGVEAVSEEISEPMRREMRRVVTEARLGRPLEQSLDAVAERMDSNDFGWAVMAIRIQREVGGNLAELLLTVADTMVQRERLRRDVSALTAEGKISAIVLAILPVGLGIAMYMINREYIEVLFEGVGRLLLAGALGLALVGFYWMKKTIEIDV